MAKKTRAQAAARGTKADAASLARTNARSSGPHEDQITDGRPTWWLPALSEANLSNREQLTKRMFTTVQVVLCLVLIATFVSISLTSGGLSVKGLQGLFARNPAATVSMLAACAQPFVAYLLRFVYKRYAEGDAGYATANLIALLCAEMTLQSMVGIIAMALLLWRVWHRGARCMTAWRKHRGIGGMLVDLSGSIVVMMLGIVCLIASMRLRA